MAWTIPDQGEPVSDFMSVYYQENMDVLIEALGGYNCVLSGFDFTGGADMTPDIAKGAVLTNGILKAVAAGTVTIGTADATNPRLDLIVVNSSGALAVRAGTAGASPKPPARSTNDVVLWMVYVPAGDTAIATNQAVDLRVNRRQGPICIYMTTAAETTDTTASAIHILDKTNSGVVIPSGLLVSTSGKGKILRCKIWGNALINSGTPTSTIAISFGGTTWLSDVTAAGAADADRRAWTIEFDIVVQGNSDQALGGMINIQVQAAAVTAPTTGIAGDIGGTTTATASIISPFQGAAGTVDVDAADRTLAVTWTFNVSNAANQIVVEAATLELFG